MPLMFPLVIFIFLIILTINYNHYILTSMINNFHKANLGTVTVTTSTGLYYNKDHIPVTFDMHLELEWNGMTPEIENGEISYANVKLYAYYDENVFQIYTKNYSIHQGHGEIPYTDENIERQVNEYLKSKGINSYVNWSEYGMQENGIANFDVDFDIVFEVFYTNGNDYDIINDNVGL